MKSCRRCHLLVRFVHPERIRLELVLEQLVQIQSERRELMDDLQQQVRLVDLFGADQKPGKAIPRLEPELRGKEIQRTVPERLDKADQRQFQLLGSRNQIQLTDAAMGSQWFQLGQQKNRFQPGLGNCNRRLAAGLVGKMEPSTMESSLPLDNQLAGRSMERILSGDHHRRLALDQVGRSCNRSGPSRVADRLQTKLLIMITCAWCQTLISLSFYKMVLKDNLVE